jgi:hypothetical protein
MANLYELAEFLISAWKLGTKPNERMPTSHGILDAALFRLRDSLPERFAGLLTFGDTRMGFRCHELSQLLNCAQENLLTSEPNPTYLTTEVQISDGTACALLFRRGLDPVDAEAFGASLSSTIREIKNSRDVAVA